jgi:hypothetical protein
VFTASAAPAEYLVTAADEKAIRDAYAGFAIKSVMPIAHPVFRVVFDPDPGLAALENLRGIRAVQPNQRYRASPK